MSEFAYQLAVLREDAEFARIELLIAKEIRPWLRVSLAHARCIVLSAIGEPHTIDRIHRAWEAARKNGEPLGLAKVIVRRRVLDWLRRERRPLERLPLPSDEALEDAPAQPSFHGLLQRDPQAQLEYHQLVHLMRGSLACFAAQGAVQRRQAALIERYALDETEHAELSAELACSQGALRVRVHKAIRAFGRHIRTCHPALIALAERGADATR